MRGLGKVAQVLGYVAEVSLITHRGQKKGLCNTNYLCEKQV